MTWDNRSEVYVDIFRESRMKDLKDSNAPLVFWCSCAELQSKIINAKFHENFHLNGQTP